MNGSAVGTFALLVMDNLLYLGRPSGIVEAVAVAPAYQDQGISKAMMLVFPGAMPPRSLLQDMDSVMSLI